MSFRADVIPLNDQVQAELIAHAASVTPKSEKLHRHRIEELVWTALRNFLREKSHKHRRIAGEAIIRVLAYEKLPASSKDLVELAKSHIDGLDWKELANNIVVNDKLKAVKQKIKKSTDEYENDRMD